MAEQAGGWVNDNLGWATLIASVIVAAVTIVYVMLTWRLVRVDREATKEAREANELARQALDNDRRQYELAVRNQQDAAMPAVVVQFDGSQIHGSGSQGSTVNVGTVTPEQFAGTTVLLDNYFRVKNHGPGPAMLWIEVEVEAGSPIDVQESVDGVSVYPPRPVVVEVSPTDHTYLLRIITRGHDVAETIAGTDYAHLRFRWSAYSQREVYDEVSLTLNASPLAMHGESITNEVLANAFSLPSRLLLPEKRTRPTGAVTDSDEIGDKVTVVRIHNFSYSRLGWPGANSVCW